VLRDTTSTAGWATRANTFIVVAGRIAGRHGEDAPTKWSRRLLTLSFKRCNMVVAKTGVPATQPETSPAGNRHGIADKGRPQRLRAVLAACPACSQRGTRTVAVYTLVTPVCVIIAGAATSTPFK